MNPRDFCRMPGYKSALALTYNFDPLFFERVILHDLWIGGTSETVVLADSRQLYGSMPQYIGHLRHLGRSYCLAPAGPMTCHPKIILRLGPQGAAIWIGSANLTQGGWGGNRELATWCVLDGENRGATAMARSILSAARAACLNPAVVQNIEQIGRQPWLIAKADEPLGSALLLTGTQSSLAAQLAQRWSGRQFTTLRLITGSTDRDGAFIKWCGQALGVQRCVIAVNPATAAFEPAALEKLSVHTTIAPDKNSRLLHAKFYWFDGPDGPAAVIGSANCSRAAWLKPLHEQGNLEAVMVYDHPSAVDFSAILSLLPDIGVSAASIEGWGLNATEDGQDTCPSEIRLLELSVMGDRVSALLNRSLSPDAEVTLEIGTSLVALSSSNDALTLWESPLLAEDRGVTDFGRVLVRALSYSFETNWHWIDNKEAILRSSRRKVLGTLPRSFDSFASKQEKDQLLADIALVTKTLITDPAAFADPSRSKRQASDGTSTPEPIQPGQLLRNLAEIETANPLNRLTASQSTSLSLHGVLEALFGQLEDDETDTAVEPELDLESIPATSPSEVAISPRQRPTKAEPVTDRQRKRLLRIMETFYEGLLDAKFVHSCTADQLVQASAYPLLVAALGRRSGWLSNSESRKLLLTTADALFRTQIKGCEGCGVIDAVRKRFISLQRLDVFEEAVADGALWVAIVGAIAGIHWDDDTGYIERAIVMRDVSSRADLLQSSNLERLSALAARLRVAQEMDGVIAKAAAADRLLSQLEGILQENWNKLMEYQLGHQHESGDIIWKPQRWGTVRTGGLIQKGSKVNAYWGWHGETVKMAANGLFVNVRIVAAYCQPINETVEKLAKTWSASP